MPQLPPVPKTIRSTIHMTDAHNAGIVNVLHWRYEKVLDQTDAFALAQGIANAWSVNVMPLLSQDAMLQRVDVVDLDSPIGAVGTAVNPTPGSVNSMSYPAGVCAVISERVIRRFRGGHGRIYLSGISPFNNGGEDILTAAFQALLTSALEKFKLDTMALSLPTAGLIQLVVVSYYEGFTNVTDTHGRSHARSTLRVGGPVVDPVVALVCNPKFGSQRRRNLYGK